MKISYAITVCNEFVEIQKLIPFILQHKRTHDDIVVLYDKKNGDSRVDEYLRNHSVNNDITLHSDFFQDHFADWKNKLTSFCSGDYIFQIDADELPHEELVTNLHTIIDNNPTIDVYVVPRVNIIDGLTQQHIDKWGWRVNEKNWSNWPDYQWRIYKNKPDIKWVNKLHEKLYGHKTIASLPSMEKYALYHLKDIERQLNASRYYDSLCIGQKNNQ
jgi:hypothetical protein